MVITDLYQAQTTLRDSDEVKNVDVVNVTLSPPKTQAVVNSSPDQTSSAYSDSPVTQTNENEARSGQKFTDSAAKISPTKVVDLSDNLSLKQKVDTMYHDKKGQLMQPSDDVEYIFDGMR